MVPIPAGETHPQAIARGLWLREKWRRQKRIQRQRAKGILSFRPTRHRLLRVGGPQAEAHHSEGGRRTPPPGAPFGPPSLRTWTAGF